jgi:hypothetical protein
MEVSSRPDAGTRLRQAPDSVSAADSKDRNQGVCTDAQFARELRLKNVRIAWFFQRF